MHHRGKLAISCNIKGFLHFSESYVALDKSFCMKLAKPMQVCVPPGPFSKFLYEFAPSLTSLCMPDANTSRGKARIFLLPKALVFSAGLKKNRMRSHIT
jgi:hypothetical protein